MKRNFVTALLLILLALLLFTATWWYKSLSADYSAPEAQDQGQNSGEPAPDFTVYDGEGNAVKLSDFAGTPVVINFWATWCSPCKAELPAFEAAFQQYGEQVHFMMVNMTDGARDTVDGVKDFVSGGEYSFPLYLDTELDAAYAYGVYSIPMTVFINANGSLYKSHSSMISEEKLNNYIDALIENNQ